MARRGSSPGARSAGASQPRPHQQDFASARSSTPWGKTAGAQAKPSTRELGQPERPLCCKVARLKSRMRQMLDHGAQAKSRHPEQPLSTAGFAAARGHRHSKARQASPGRLVAKAHETSTSPAPRADGSTQAPPPRNCAGASQAHARRQGVPCNAAADFAVAPSWSDQASSHRHATAPTCSHLEHAPTRSVDQPFRRQRDASAHGGHQPPW